MMFGTQVVALFNPVPPLELEPDAEPTAEPPRESAIEEREAEDNVLVCGRTGSDTGRADELREMV